MLESNQAVPLKRKSRSNAYDRLLEAAVDVFGKHGFEAATTRMIAKQAGVNIAAIPYYFNGKEGLYHAVAAHIVGKLESQVRPTLLEIERRYAQKNLERQEALALLEMLLGKWINFMVGSSEAPRFARIVLREQLYPTSAYDIIFNRVMSPMIDAITKMAATAMGEPLSREASLRAMALMGQVIVFRVARETMVRFLNLEGYSPEETAEIRTVILQQTRATLEAMSRPQAG